MKRGFVGLALVPFFFAASASAFTFNAFSAAQWQVDDGILGIAGFTIEDFEDTTLVPGLQIELSDTVSDDYGPTGTLPLLFNPVTNVPPNSDFFDPGRWDGDHIFLNRGSAIPGNFLDFNWGDVTFLLNPGATSFGFSLMNLDIAAFNLKRFGLR